MSRNELDGQVALVTGGGRGIGANIARELAGAGMDVWVTGRTAQQVEAVAHEIGGHALVGDVSSRDDVERWARDAGALDLLVCNAGISGPGDVFAEPEEWWRTFEVNVLGVYLCCRAFAPGMIERGGGRIVNVASGAAYLPTRFQNLEANTAYPASKAAVHRFSEVLATELAPSNVFVFSISPGLVQTEMTSGMADDAPWTPPECAPRLVRALATGEFDALAGRYLHAEHDPPERLRERTAAIQADDLNVIRLRR
ncbi:MAG TPA: SDR family NAD(P)-dependent oxidoreductase [Gaiellaceae bacterium]|nr:SDR family NAD(P)-dependent oxidoreductase [Gaiellaceae bacterium]